MTKFKIKLVGFLLFISIVFSNLAAPTVYAQEPVGLGKWWLPRYNDFIEKVNKADDNEIFGERYTHAQVSWIIHSVLNILVGPIMACAEDKNPGECIKNALSSNQDQGAILPLAAFNDAIIRNKPASGIDYVAQKLDKFNLIQVASAQADVDVGEAGFGFARSLAIVQPIWTVSRDAAYALVIFAILILAFMVMLRTKLSPHTVVTIQSSIPRVALGLLLITFSYAIAGFMIDLVYILLGLTSGILATSTLTSLSANDAVEIFQQINDAIGGTLAFFLAFIVALALLAVPVVGAGVGVGFLASLISAPMLVGLGPIMAGISVLVLLLIIVILIVAIVRILWVMIRTYVVILMLVIASPFLMLMGIVRSSSISMWFKSLAAQLSVLFTVPLLITLAHIILFSTNSNSLISAADSILKALGVAGGRGVNIFSIDSQFSRSPDVGFFPGGFSFGGTQNLGLIVSLAVIISAPRLASSVRDYILTGRAAFGFAGLGEALGPAAGLAALGAGIGRQEALKKIGNIAGAIADPKTITGPRKVAAAKMAGDILGRIGVGEKQLKAVEKILHDYKGKF